MLENQEKTVHTAWTIGILRNLNGGSRVSLNSGDNGNEDVEKNYYYFFIPIITTPQSGSFTISDQPGKENTKQKKRKEEQNLRLIFGFKAEPKSLKRPNCEIQKW
jgi:hypothetical protein